MTDRPNPPNDKPVHRVALAGLEGRDVRLIEIVFRHSRYNRVGFELVQPGDQCVVDILVANPYDNDGLRAMARARAAHRPVPVVVVVPDGHEAQGRYTIELDKLPLQLLPTLNRLVRSELHSGSPAPRVLRSRAPASAQGQARPVDGASTRGAGSASAGATDGVSSRASAMAATRPDAPAGVQPAHTGSPVTAVPPPMPPAARATGSASSSGAAAPLEPVAALGRRGRATAIAVEPANPDERPGDAPATLIFPLTGFGDSLLPATRFPPLLDARPGLPLSLRAPVAAPVPAPNEAPDTAVPALVSTRPRHVADPGAGDPAAPPVVTVLVVDDSPTVRRQLCRALARWGIDAVAVADAEAALHALSVRHFELALVDVVMPGENGFTLTREIRRRHPSTPVLLLTQRGTPIDMARGALAGCSAYLRKPIKPARLQSAVFAQLRKTLAIDDLAALLAPRRSALAAQEAAPDRPATGPTAVPPGGDPQSARRAGGR